jgi:hypothetical protein
MGSPSSPALPADGHPAPLECPPHRSRRSIAVYYYTQAGARPEEEINRAARAKHPRYTLYHRVPCEQVNAGQCATPVYCR